MRATLSMIGLYNWDPSIFDTMELPAGLDRDTVISAILLDSMDLEVLYPDPEYMKYALANYSKRRIDVWNKLYSTTKLEYNPIWNKDGTITENENIDRSRDATGSTYDSSTGDSSTRGQTDEFVYGFNESSPAQSGRTTENQSTHASDSGQSSSSENESGNENRSYTRKEQGNIGITTTQQMIKEEREVDDFSIIDYIVKDILHKMCILVY